MKWIAAGLCAFEVGAITTGRYPTLTQLSATRPWLKGTLVAALIIHLYRVPRASERRSP